MKDIVLKVSGMMCGGCENRVKSTIQNIDGVESVTADHTTGKVVVTVNSDISKSVLEKALDDIGYEVIGE